MDLACLARFAIASPLLLAGAASAQQVKLNGPLARPLGGDVQDFFLTADDGYLLYRADQRTDDLFELFARPRTGVVPRRISDGGPVTYIHPSLVAESIGRALYVGGGRLFSAALDGGDVVELTSTLPSEASVWFSNTATGPENIVLTPDESQVVFLVRHPVGQQYEIHVAPTLGGPSIRLDLPGTNPRHLRLAPDGSAVVFSSSTPKLELYRVALSGGPVVKLTPDLFGSDKVEDTFEIDALAQRVVFRAQLAGATTSELFSVPLDASTAPIRLAPGRTPTGGSLFPWFRISADGARVVALTKGREAISVPIDGGAPAIELVPAMPSGREFYGFLVAPDSATVLVNTDLLVANEYAWLRVPIDGSAPASRLTGPTRSGTFSPDGTSLLYIGENPFGIHTVLLDGSASPVFVAPLVGGVYGIAFADGGDRVIAHAARTPAGPIEALTVPASGGLLQPLNGPLPYGGNVAQLSGLGDRSVVISADGQHVVYLADEDEDEVYELFTAPADGSLPSQRVTPTMPIGPVLGDVGEYRVTPAGDLAVFLAAGESPRRVELYSARIGAGANRVALSVPLEPGDTVQEFGLSPTGASVVYAVYSEVERVSRLYVVPSAGGPSLLLAEHPNIGTLAVTPDGQRVVYVLYDPNAIERLWSVRLDGSESPIVLGGVGFGGNEVLFDVGGRIVYPAVDGDYVSRLFSVPADGSAAPLELSTPPVVKGRSFSLRLNEARDTVLYVADHQLLNRVDLLAVPSDGSAPARVLVTPPGPFRGISNFATHGDAAYFTAGLDDPDHTELYRVPLDGSAAPVKISGPVLTRVGAFQVSPDGNRVVYLADETVFRHLELFSVSASGGPAVKLSGPRQRGDVSSESFFESDSRDPFVISPDSTRVLFRADLQNSGSVRLYSVPIAGGSLPIVLDPARPRGTVAVVLAGMRFAPDGSVIGRFARLTGGFLPTGTETFLFRADPTRALSARVLGGFGTWITRQPGLDFSVLPGGDRIVYRHDQESDGVVELFLGFLPRERQHASRR